MSLRYNDDNSYFFVNGKKIFKMWPVSKMLLTTQFCLGGISNGFGATEDSDGSTSFMSTVSTKSHIKVRWKLDGYILHTVLLVIMLLFITAIICYHYAKHKSKLKHILPC